MNDKIESIDELRKAQAAAQAQGTSITNYSEWEKEMCKDHALKKKVRPGEQL